VQRASVSADTQAYMEDHLKNKDRLQQEWDTLSAYDPEPCSIVAAIEPTNMRKNRYTDILPCTHHSTCFVFQIQTEQVALIVCEATD
jgi:protein tyrosine phosphatase